MSIIDLNSRRPGKPAGDSSGGGAALPPASPPPDNGPMESRVAKLEEFAGDCRERLARIETKLDQVSHDTGQFKWFMLGAVLTILLTVVATSIAIQQMTVSTFQAAGDHAEKTSAAVAQPAALPPIIINVPAAAPAAAASR